jgi:drug/metabolite transporter (DMT)-like permease
MPTAQVPGSVAVVALGLLSAAGWGLADFGAGITSRRSQVYGVLLGSQLAGAVVALALAVALREPTPAPADLGWAAISSVFGGLGLASLYIGLARGRMSVVAPVTGVLVAAIPAVAGIALEGALPAGVGIGIGLAIASVVVVSRIGGTDDGRPSGLGWGIAAGLALGALAITLSRIGDGRVFGPLAVMRFGEVLLVAVLVAGARRPWRVPLRLWWAVAIVGALDMGATAAYVAATQAGPLAIAAVLSALYPVGTVILAVLILHERVARRHLAGIALAAVAIVLITTGSSG